MSGYRSIHREKVAGETAIWSVQATDLLKIGSKGGNNWRIWTASADGLVRSHVVTEKSMDNQAASKSTNGMLDASALKISCDIELGEPSPLGCTSISVERNYVGDDDRAGDLVVASLELAGKVGIWSFAEDMDKKVGTDDASATPKKPKPLAEFEVTNASGTTLRICPPRCSGVGDVAAAVGCLDGTIAIAATGLATPKATKDPTPAGTVLDMWGSQGAAVPLSLSWHPRATQCLAVGRQDGLVEMLTGTRKNQHRLTMHKSPVRALSFTDDGHLLIAGADDGFLCVWDVGRKVPTLVHHVRQAHKSWIMDISVLLDSQRFVTVGAEKQIHVWNLSQMYRPVHTFHTDQSVWCVQRGPRDVPRLVTGSDNGGLQVYSIES